MKTRPEKEAFEKLREEFYLPNVDRDALAELGEERYVLFERGHYGQTYVTAHASLNDASHYALHQEYAEDWAATVIYDRETGRHYVPESIVWSARGAL